ncbi:Hsp70 family protein [Desulfospira joergensenii]|uniref:Hsp70 family protein n=1 Tax=Desulfospira joergensenii TaxID=53329 RepID=UPI0003B2EC44|nr:Hsp70 family protein [Desulfospira joergensenii]
MDFQDRQFVIGIDLGTTNSAVSYVDVSLLREESGKRPDKQKGIKVFNVPQLTGHGEFSKIPVLPSFLYIPGEYDISKEVLKHPWKKREDMFAGVFARDHGSKIPSRLVSSAKTWLCNPKADRRAKILPWGGQGFEKVSPVAATAEYLSHIRSAWNHFVKDEDQFIENQFVVITVPASFNEEARDLTMEAIKIAGLGQSVTLLEEPLAAFYSWLILHETDWDQHIKEDDLVLVCDVGGGTTDFSLISLKAAQGTPRFERIAVGDHLVLGGDNIDLALAKIVEAKFKSKTSMTSDKWKTLCHRCREAKETILGKGEKSVRITIKGEGRSLIAGTLAADLTRGDVETVLRGQFFPDVDSQNLLESQSGKEIADFGLPFEKEPSVTKHIINFLENHRDSIHKALGKEDPIPDFILFNGGTLTPDLVQSRIKESIRRWFKSDEPLKPGILENSRPELAVGIGASYYGLVKQGIGVKVGSGSPRSYYLGVSVQKETEPKAVCLVERGLDEGSSISLPRMEYEVRANQPVSFPVYSSSFRSGDLAGDIIPIDKTLTSMAPIQTIIKFGKNGERKEIPVSIGAEYTEMGTLAMYCRSLVSDHRWKLQFQLRGSGQSEEGQEREIYEDAIIEKACSITRQAFSSREEDGVIGIVKKIEGVVDQKKFNWPLSFLRRLADQLIEIDSTRELSPAHESRWLNLTGFCMRPGFGDAFDGDRARKLWKIYLSGLKFDKAKQNRLEWWIFVRRIAAGLKAGQQRQFFQEVSSLLVKNKVKMAPQEMIELWMTAGNMERLLVKDKVVLAKPLLAKLKTGKSSDKFFWTLGRLGARELLYGSMDRVVPPAEVMRWTDQLMKIKWKKPGPALELISQLVRKTGDRTRDVSPEDLERAVSWLEENGAEPKLLKIVNEKIEMALKDRSVQFGERLPEGLVLK